MVHLGGVVADTRRFRICAPLCKERGAADKLNREALTDHLTYLNLCPFGLDGLYHQQTDKNEHKRESCLVEFFSRPPSAGRRLRFRRF